jgi:hypothetical protein
VSAPDGLHAGFGQAEMLDLPGLDQLFDGPGDVLDVYIRVDAVLVEQVDRFDAEPLQ